MNSMVSRFRQYSNGRRSSGEKICKFRDGSLRRSIPGGTQVIENARWGRMGSCWETEGIRTFAILTTCYRQSESARGVRHLS
jgi:hypothetical protein